MSVSVVVLGQRGHEVRSHRNYGKGVECLVARVVVPLQPSQAQRTTGRGGGGGNGETITKGKRDAPSINIQMFVGFEELKHNCEIRLLGYFPP